MNSRRTKLHLTKSFAQKLAVSFWCSTRFTTKAGVVLARKPGKLPLPGTRVSYELEYGSEALEISKDSIQPGDKVLIVDDLLATGGSAKALAQIVELSKAEVAGVLFYVELTPLKGREELNKYKVLSIVPIEAY